MLTFSLWWQCPSHTSRLSSVFNSLPLSRACASPAPVQSVITIELGHLLVWAAAVRSACIATFEMHDSRECAAGPRGNVLSLYELPQTECEWVPLSGEELLLRHVACSSARDSLSIGTWRFYCRSFDVAKKKKINVSCIFIQVMFAFYAQDIRWNSREQSLMVLQVSYNALSFPDEISLPPPCTTRNPTHLAVCQLARLGARESREKVTLSLHSYFRAAEVSILTKLALYFATSSSRGGLFFFSLFSLLVYSLVLIYIPRLWRKKLSLVGSLVEWRGGLLQRPTLLLIHSIYLDEMCLCERLLKRWGGGGAESERERERQETSTEKWDRKVFRSYFSTFFAETRLMGYYLLHE